MPVQVALLTAVVVALSLLLCRRFLFRPTGSGECPCGLYVAVVVTGLLCRLAFVVGTPLFRAPDEEAHFNYIKYVAHNLSFPVQVKDAGPEVNENWQAPLYYVVMAPVYSAVSAMSDSENATVYVLRGFSVLCWLLNLWFAFMFLNHLRIEDSFLRLLFLLPLCLLPTYIFTSAAINNDNLLILVGGAALCVLAKSPLSPTRATAFGCLLGIGMLTKLTALVYIPVLAAMSLLDCVRKRTRLTSALLSCVAAIAIATATFAPWAVRNQRLYGSVTGENAGDFRYHWQSVFQGIDCSISYMSDSFWAASGAWNDIGYPFCVFARPILWFALGGLAYLAVSRSNRPGHLGPARTRDFVVALAMAVSINLLLVLRMGVLYGQAQGRHLFALLYGISLLLSIGLRQYPINGACRYLVAGAIAYAVGFTVFSCSLLMLATSL